MVVVNNALLGSDEVPKTPADEYHQCNFAVMEPMEDGGKVVGVPLKSDAVFVECNLVNRMPSPDAILVRCNTTIKRFGVAIDDKRIADVVYGHYDEVKKEVVRYPEPVVVNVQLIEEQ